MRQPPLPVLSQSARQAAGRRHDQDVEPRHPRSAGKARIDERHRVPQALLHRVPGEPERIPVDRRPAQQAHPRRPMPLAMLAPQKPWVVAVTFLAKELERNGLDPEHGIDRHFVDAADAASKPIKSLETLEDQLGIFDKMPDATQELFLREALEEADLVGKQIAELTDAWKRGDEAALGKLLATSYEKAEYKTLQKQLIFDRNVRMAKAVEGMLAGADDVFVVVGVAHLVGEGGVVDLLRKAKHPVDRL
ncbi:MAG: TraB/GumN family protein [Gemmatimonadaceae bacterium]|nr:TraB/GumN family protein [Gemmatimonadaceae bacterium]